VKRTARLVVGWLVGSVIDQVVNGDHLSSANFAEMMLCTAIVLALFTLFLVWSWSSLSLVTVLRLLD
jgi:hypothetical protein